MEQLPLFVFGTLRRGQCNHNLLEGRYKRRASATLHGFTKSDPLMIVPRAGAKVAGELYDLHAESYQRTLGDCDELEEVPHSTLVGRSYRRLRVLVSTDEGERLAWAYVHAATPDDWCERVRGMQ
jgi:gamma-glutamylcyclotransferase (GGCT)/AIG2-like uncharacterized protein YtfP